MGASKWCSAPASSTRWLMRLHSGPGECEPTISTFLDSLASRFPLARGRAELRPTVTTSLA